MPGRFDTKTSILRRLPVARQAHESRQYTPRSPDVRKASEKERSTGGFAVVEATILFPFMFMVFLALVLCAIYLPQRAILQRATQLAATAIATEIGDTWIEYDVNSMSYKKKTSVPGVYASMFNTDTSAYANKAVNIARKIDEKENIPLISNGTLTVSCTITNYAIYREVTVTSTRKINVPVDFSWALFPRTIEMSVTAKATVKDGDGFVGNVDMGIGFLAWLDYQFGRGYGGEGFDLMRECFGHGTVSRILGLSF